MLNLSFLRNILIILILIFVQVFVFSNFKINALFSPYIYILFILLYPPNQNRYVFLLLCFLLGVGIDIFEHTGGINAFASVTIGLLSNHLLRMISGTKFFEIEEFQYSDFGAVQWFFYVIFMVFIHHFLLFWLESFSLLNFGNMMLKVLYSSAFTSIFVFFYLLLFRKRAER